MTLSCDNLTIKRGQSRVVDGLSVRLELGQITAIVGPNGAGKSSLLLGLAGLLPPELGAVHLDGESVGSIAPRQRARSIGYLPQEGQIAWDVSVDNLVRLGRQPHGDKATAPVERAISAMELEALRRRPASRLSGGERARALLARILAGEPRWILADEPLAALDLAHQLNLLSHFKRTAQSGVGVVMVLHDLALAMNHADRVLVLDRGQLIADNGPGAALSSEVIEKVWGVSAQWIAPEDARNNEAEAGQHALIATKKV